MASRRFPGFELGRPLNQLSRLFRQSVRRLTTAAVCTGLLSPVSPLALEQAQAKQSRARGTNALSAKPATPQTGFYKPKASYVIKGKTFHYFEQRNQKGRVTHQTIVGPDYREILIDVNGDGILEGWDLNIYNIGIRKTLPKKGRFTVAELEHIDRRTKVRTFGRLKYDPRKRRYVGTLKKERIRELASSGENCDPKSEANTEQFKEIVDAIKGPKVVSTNAVPQEVRTPATTETSPAAALSPDGLVHESCRQEPFAELLPSILAGIQAVIASVDGNETGRPSTKGRYLQCLRYYGFNTSEARIKAALQMSALSGGEAPGEGSETGAFKEVKCRKFLHTDDDEDRPSIVAGYDAASRAINFYKPILTSARNQQALLTNNPEGEGRDRFGDAFFHELVHADLTSKEADTKDLEQCCGSRNDTAACTRIATAKGIAEPPAAPASEGATGPQGETTKSPSRLSTDSNSPSKEASPLPVEAATGAPSPSTIEGQVSGNGVGNMTTPPSIQEAIEALGGGPGPGVEIASGGGTPVLVGSGGEGTDNLGVSGGGGGGGSPETMAPSKEAVVERPPVPPVSPETLNPEPSPPKPPQSEAVVPGVTQPVITQPVATQPVVPPSSGEAAPLQPPIPNGPAPAIGGIESGGTSSHSPPRETAPSTGNQVESPPPQPAAPFAPGPRPVTPAPSAGRVPVVVAPGRTTAPPSSSSGSDYTSRSRSGGGGGAPSGHILRYGGVSNPTRTTAPSIQAPNVSNLNFSPSSTNGPNIGFESGSASSKRPAPQAKTTTSSRPKAGTSGVPPSRAVASRSKDSGTDNSESPGGGSAGSAGADGAPSPGGGLQGASGGSASLSAEPTLSQAEEVRLATARRYLLTRLMRPYHLVKLDLQDEEFVKQLTQADIQVIDDQARVHGSGRPKKVLIYSRDKNRLIVKRDRR